MPKKKKGNFGVDSETGGGTSSVKRRVVSSGPTRTAHGRDGEGGGPITPGDADSEDVRNQELRYLQDMFAGKLDSVVVHMIMNDCDFKVEAALETLFELADQTSPTESQMYRLSGFKDVYIPKREEADYEDLDQEGEDSQYLHVSPFSQRPNVVQSQLESSQLVVDSETMFQQARRRGDREISRELGSNSVHQGNQVQPSSELGATCSVKKTDAMDNFSQQKEDAASSKEFHKAEWDAFEGDSTREFSSPRNNLNQNKTSEAVGRSTDEECGSSKRFGIAENQPSSNCKLAKTSSLRQNIHLDKVPSRAKVHVESFEQSAAEEFFPQSPGSVTHANFYGEKDNSLFDEDASATEVLKENDPASHPVGSEVPLKEVHQLTSSPVEIPSEELEALLDEIEMCSEKSSGSKDKPEPTITEQRGHSSEASNEQDETEKCLSIKPAGMIIGTDSYKIGHTMADQSRKAEGPNHQASQPRPQAVPGDPQQHYLNTATPAFIPRAFARCPTPGHHQYQALQGFQTRSAHHRLPSFSRPAGRASSLQQHLNHLQGHIREPLFVPFPNSQEQRPLTAKGVEPQEQLPSQPMQHFPRQNLATLSAQPFSKLKSQAPFWPRNQAPHPQQRFPGLPVQNEMCQPFHPQTMPLKQGTPPPERMRTNSPHEGARQPTDAPRWPVVNHPSYAPRLHVDSPRLDGSDDKAVLLPGGKVLCLMRGCPGSGKTTLARKLVGNGKVLSSDNYFINDYGQYHFDITKLSNAHDWSHKQAKEAMESGVTPLIIDNTNIERWTMKPYVAMALKYGYAVEFREPTTPWKFKLGKLSKYNTHGVPQERIKIMLERFEKDVTVENILGSSKPSTSKRQNKAEAAKRPPSPKSWRNPKREGKEEPKVVGNTNEETSWRRPWRRDDVTLTRTRPVKDDVAVSSTAVEGSVMPVVSAADVKKDGLRKKAEAAKHPPPAKSWRKPKREGQRELKVAGKTTEETSWRKPWRRDDVTLNPARTMEDDVTATSTVGEELTMSVVSVATDDSVGEKQEEGPIGDEMFKDKGDGDALIDSLACVSFGEAIPGADKKELDEAPLVDARDNREGVEEVMSVSDTVFPHNTYAESEPKTTVEILPESILTDDTETIIDVKVTRQSLLEVAEDPSGVKGEDTCKTQPDEPGVTEAENDDILAMLNAMTHVSHPETFSPNNNDGEGHQIKSIGDEEFEAVMSSFSQIQSMHRLPSVTCEPRPQGKQKDDAGDESSNGEDDFAAMMNLVAEASCVQSHPEVAPHRDELVTDAHHQKVGEPDKDDDNQTAEKSLERDDHCKAIYGSAPGIIEERASQMQLDDNSHETQDSAERVASEEDIPCHVEESRDQDDELRQQENAGGAETQNKSNKPTRRSHPVAEPQAVRKQNFGRSQKMDHGVNENMQSSDITQKVVPDLSQTITNISSSVESELSHVSLSINADSLSESTPEGHGCRESVYVGLPVKININKEEATSGAIRETNGGQQAKKNGEYGSNLRNSKEEVQASSTIENETCPVETAVPERKLEREFRQSVVCAGDINSNHMEGIKHEKETDGSQPPQSVVCRSLSPTLLATSLGISERITKQRHKNRDLRRSRSFNKMAAVFPSLSPGLRDWSDLAEQVDQAGAGYVSKPQISSVDADVILKSDAGTMTSASDLACLQKFKSGRLSVEDLQRQGLRVACGQPRQISASAGGDTATEKEPSLPEPYTPDSSGKRSPIPATVKLHKSTMTDCEEHTGNIGNKLNNLVALFPSVSTNYLEDILATCAGDVEWATNILLDDFRGIETSNWKHQDTGGTPVITHRSPNSQQGIKPCGMDTNVEESQPDCETLAKMAAFKDLLEVKRASQADNLTTGTIPVTDDTTNKSLKHTRIPTEMFSNVKEQPPESDKNEIHQVGALDVISLSQVDESSPESGDNPNCTNAEYLHGHQDSTQAVKSDISNFEEEPVQKRAHHLSETITVTAAVSQKEEPFQGVLFPEGLRACTEDSMLPVEQPQKYGPVDMQIARDEIRTVSESDVLEGPTTESAYRSQPTESDQSDGLINYTNSTNLERKQGFQWSDFQQGPGPECTRKDQAVRPKIPSGSKLRQVTTTVPKIRKPRRDELDAVRGVQFSWNGPSKEEEFSMPHPEQVMTVSEDSVREEDGSAMTGEQADTLKQDQTLPRKWKELSSLKEGLILQLPAAFALQLQEMFGSISFHLFPDGLPAEDLQVHVDYDLAKQLHSLWGQTLQTRFNKAEELESIIKKDEELARKLQQEEDIHHLTKVQSERSAKYQGTKASPNRQKQPVSLQLGYGDSKGTMAAFASPGRQPLDQGKGLKEIMEEELAAQLSQDVEVEEKLNTEESASIATKLKRGKLYSEFPTLDRGVLEDIYRANDYQLEPTVKQVNSFFISASGQPKDVYSKEALDRIEKDLIEMTERESLASSEETDDSNPSDGYYQSVDNPDYQDYRAEATQHYRLRHEAFQKAAEAYNRGQRELASFYSQQGHLHTEKLKAANKRASEAIVYSKNSLYHENTLDLHGLHVDEALMMLEQVLTTKKAELSAYYDQQPHPPVGKPPQKHIFIVTGKGNHSRGGVARIRPAITDSLKREGYRFSMVNAGLIKVVM